MDPASSPLGRLLAEQITPVVMVVSTPLAEEACKKSGLSFVQLLRPFTVFQNIDVPVRTASDLPYRLQSFKVRMVYASDVRQPDHEVVINNLMEMVSDASEKTAQMSGSRENLLSDLHSDPPPLEDLLSMSESEIQPLWFRTFNEGLSQAVSYSDHEAFDHPVACLLVVSPKDELLMNTFVDLLNINQLPPILNDGAMDPKILKHYLLLHDNQDDTVEKSAGILSEMRSTFGLQNCRLLCINSATEAMEWEENPWNFCKTNTNHHYLLNVDDCNELKEFMQDLTSKKIIPYMEQKIRILNQQVSATRKGFKNQIKNLWWRKGKEDTSDAPDGPMYTFSSIESQIRVLGDYAFMLRDYELALSNYRLLSTDYKLDKAWKRYAGAQEMVGLSLFMLDQSRKDSEYCMENAFTTYLKLGSSELKNATRCGIWWAEMLKAWTQHKEAAAVYFRTSNEEPSLHAAVLLEQSSYCYLFSNPPMLRKFGFHLVLAGNRYFISDQRRHAIRTYRIALSVYSGNAWSYINDHVHFNIGRWYAFYKMFDAAIKHMLQVLECSHQSLTTQDLFLGDFFQIIQNMGRKLEVVKLQLPSVNISSLKVIFEDHRTCASSAAVLVKESVWQSLEENLVPPVTTVRSNWLESQKLYQPKKDNDDSISVLGEAIKVHLEFKNPLQISISVSAASLVCECVPAKDAQNNLVQEIFSSDRDQKDDTSLFDLSKHDFVLGGGETKEVQLEVTPKTEGYLKIIGVSWTLSGHVVGCHNFDLSFKKKNRKKRAVELFQRQSMSFIVVKGLPKLEGSMHNLPKTAYCGELRLATLELRNKSDYSVKNMKLKINHPRFLIPGGPGELEFPDCLRKGTRSNSVDLQEHAMEKSENHLFSFPSDAEIPGESVFKWSFWLHTAYCGHISLYLSLYYEVENCNCDMEYRTLRMNYDLEVLPSLDVSIFITPCTSKLQEFLVRMEVASRTSSESFWLRQLSSVGHQWEISLLPAYASACPSQLLLAGQTLLCFFKLKDIGQKSIEKNTSSVCGSDLHLGSIEDDQIKLDISKTPLHSFHHQERLHQGKSLEKFPASVDFVLISQLVGDDAMPDSGEHARLLSHHLCHRSIASKCPIWWTMHGPQTVSHDFSVSFCEMNFHVTIYNCSEAMASIKFATFDSMMSTDQSKDEPLPSDSSLSQAGWHDISLVTSDTLETRDSKKLIESITPFQWCALSSTQVELAPISSAVIPLQICLFSPGIYDVSSYELQWSLQASAADGCANNITWESSGKNKGHPFYLTALQSSM